MARILTLRELAPGAHAEKSNGLLLPRGGQSRDFVCLSVVGVDGGRATRGLLRPYDAAPLRHGFASETIRCGVSLPALMQLLGQKDKTARRRAAQPYRVPARSVPCAPTAGLPGICQALAATRLDRRLLLAVATEVEKLATGEQ